MGFHKPTNAFKQILNTFVVVLATIVIDIISVAAESVFTGYNPKKTHLVLNNFANKVQNLIVFELGAMKGSFPDFITDPI